MPPNDDVSALEGWLAGGEPLLELPVDTGVATVVHTLRDRGLDACTVDLAGVHDKAGLLRAFHTALELGDWFGFNWDALEDALYGTEDREASDRLLVLYGFQAFATRAPDDAAVLLDILRSVAAAPGSGLRGAVLIGGASRP